MKLWAIIRIVFGEFQMQYNILRVEFKIWHEFIKTSNNREHTFADDRVLL